ncbi:site-specific integrase [Colwellia sp. BRX10-4]|jgi:integrase|uniref:site-specific integrase n=1 Tax=Colwellia sp. BRX10-4 TaxID=2759843 RepID=UPI0015F4852E|nr:site-specific integrase [Colwellia sp. BRX10-4]MBA6397148.1 site-specific integrase [Colwellia sp. BRX10-4]
MYLTKNRNGTYYTRISLPKSLRDDGFPFSVRTSLQTKVRSTAINRNLSASLFIRQLIDSNDQHFNSKTFKYYIQQNLHLFKTHEFNPKYFLKNVKNEGKEIIEPSNIFDIDTANKEFLIGKEKEDISYRSLNQLKLRTKHFIVWYKQSAKKEISPSLIMQYRNFLISEKRSYKTNRDYMASNSQFLKWCVIVEYIKTNPFEKVSLGQKPIKKKHEQRERWSKSQLLALFEQLNERLNNKKRVHRYADYWIPLICLYSGLRISEACQLSIDNIYKVDDIYIFDVDSADKDVQLKTVNAYRQVPIHSQLIKLGLLAFMELKKSQGSHLLFNEKSEGAYADWSKRIGGRLKSVLQNISLNETNRLTLYGLRHTFIDELQQADVNENIVAELVGHSKRHITYGRYGKKINIKLLKQKIELMAIYNENNIFNF